MFGLIDNAFNHFVRMEDFDFPKPEMVINGFKLNDGNYELKIALDKRVKDDDINVDVEGNVVTVTYKYADKDSKFSAASSETLPEDADMSSAEAELEDGTLTVRVRQVPQKKTPKRVDVNFKK